MTPKPTGCSSSSLRRWPRASPSGRLGQPIELGSLVAFLASEQAAYITGAVYQIDGGNIKSNL